jgi:hypothetical protein
MGFSKYANAAVVKPSINLERWDEIRAKAVSLGPSFGGRTAGHVVLQEYKPEDHILTHCTIIASVDTEASPRTQLGVQMMDGVQINRKYADYYITPETTKYINNNNDSFERKLLLASFKTFIGGENFCEHIQIPELSKGKIIDAAARDIGDSVYVDILVATNRKHKPLIAAIEAGQLSTLSMGAQVAFTICTKCGNVAEDELQLCRHIKYQKGNFFIDAMGKRRKIAELCGHVTAEPGSCKFIEASWVANPAFTGAVLRNILDPRTVSDSTVLKNKVQVAFSQPARTVDPGALQKAAKLAPVGTGVPAKLADDLVSQFEGVPSLGSLSAPRVDSNSTHAEIQRRSRLCQIAAAAVMSEQGQEPAFEVQDPTAPTKDDKGPFDKPVKEIKDQIVEQVTEQIKDELAKSKQDGIRHVLNENEANESLIKSALRTPEWRKRAQQVLKMASGNTRIAKTLISGLVLFEHGGWSAVASSRRFTGTEILAISRVVDRLTKKASMAGESRVYQTVLAVGGTASYPNVDNYLEACRRVVGRDLTESEKIQLVFKGQLYSLGR